jgi:hypothetical protein
VDAVEDAERNRASGAVIGAGPTKGASPSSPQDPSAPEGPGPLVAGYDFWNDLRLFVMAARRNLVPRLRNRPRRGTFIAL